MNHNPEVGQLDWGKFRQWQVWDPIPWWILDREKLQEILVAQLEFKAAMMKQELEQLEKIRNIVKR